MSGGLRKQRLQRGLVVAQIAVSVVLLAGAGLLTRTMIQLSEVSTGLKTEEVLTMPVPLLNPAQRLTRRTTPRPRRFTIACGARSGPSPVSSRWDSAPRCRSAARRSDSTSRRKAKPLAVGEAMPHAEFRTASPEYFRAAGIPLLKGREFSTTDRPGSGKVVIINQTLADKFFPGEDPLGKRIAWTGDVLRFTPDQRRLAHDRRRRRQYAGRRAGCGAPSRDVHALCAGAGAGRRAGDPRRQQRVGPGGAATRIVRRIAPTAPIENVMTVAQIKDQSVSPRRLNAALISSFGILAVIIAAVGIAGVLAFSVSARTNEIGIRMSLGADSGRVQRMILREGGVLLAIGLVLGVAGAFFAAGVIRGLLFGVAPHDPVTFIGVAVMMAAIGIGACWIPALRAARIDPAITMRS